jgi:hypothetical protein
MQLDSACHGSNFTYTCTLVPVTADIIEHIPLFPQVKVEISAATVLKNFQKQILIYICRYIPNTAAKSAVPADISAGCCR